MATKRDQLQAFQFLNQRAVSALVIRETDPEQPPFRRQTGGSLAGVAVAIVALACVGVYGMLVPGGNSGWRSGDAVIVEKETGTRHVYLDGRLHPVANYTSALLLLGSHARTERVSRDSLVDVPRGPRLGIPDAPDALPGRDHLLTDAWSLCSTPARDVSGGRVHESVLLAGAPPTGGMPLGDAAALVEQGDRHLVWRGHRHRIVDFDTVGTGLGLRASAGIKVGKAWLDQLPEGAPISPIPVTDAGAVSTAVPGDVKVGSLLVVQTPTGGAQHYLAERETLRAITPLQYEIQRAHPSAGTTPRAIPLAPSLAAAAKRTDPTPVTPDAAPETRPSIIGVDREVTMCATFASADPVPHLSIDPTLPPTDPMTATARRSAQGTPLADRVHIPPGWAAVVEAMPTAQTPAGTVTVVTDMGRRYPVAEWEVLSTLGYGDVTPVKLPATLIARLPEGPSLDPLTARKQTLTS